MEKELTMGRKIRQFGSLLLVLSLFSGALMPAPAQAAFSVTDAPLLAKIQEKWAQRSVYWGEMVSTLQATLQTVADIFTSVNTNMEELSREINKASAMRTSGYQAMIKADTNLTQARSDAVAARDYVENAAEVRMKHVQPQNKQLCNNIVARKGVATTKSFRSSVSSMASSAIDTMYRGPEDDGSGPQYASDSLQAAKELGVMSEVDGVTEGVDKTTKGTDGRSLQGAHLTASVFDGGQVLEVPNKTRFEKDGVTFEAPDPENAEQKFWVAGLYYCKNLVGPSPTPPNKEEIETSEGMTRRAQWNHCAAARSALTRACTNLLAFYSRPNKTFVDVLKEQKSTYEAISNLGVILSAAFAGGEKGLSPYQEIVATQSICKSNQYYVALKQSGATDAELMASVARCTASWNTWEVMQERMRGALTKATIASEKLRECWEGTEKK